MMKDKGQPPPFATYSGSLVQRCRPLRVLQSELTHHQIEYGIRERERLHPHAGMEGHGPTLARNEPAWRQLGQVDCIDPNIAFRAFKQQLRQRTVTRCEVEHPLAITQ